MRFEERCLISRGEGLDELCKKARLLAGWDHKEGYLHVFVLGRIFLLHRSSSVRAIVVGKHKFNPRPVQ